jgi:alkanesulfonate monooxygenase SsuD/methylene tetrahydromethanopterin reductase-like flavin-dependent oxidoreductase (luciferase family)
MREIFCSHHLSRFSGGASKQARAIDGGQGRPPYWSTAQGHQQKNPLRWRSVWSTSADICNVATDGPQELAWRGWISQEHDMKFTIGPLLPALPATLEEREKLRPIAHRTERWQRMFKEIVELARIADDLGFYAIHFAEHHLCTEGLEVGSVPSLYLYVAMNTKNIRVGPVGYVLPGWNPLRLAVEIGWLDQLTQGRTIVGMARGYQTRWLNQMGQKLHIQGTSSDQGEIDKANRRAFEEHFRILKLAWSDEGFTFKGDFWEYPYPYDEGTPMARGAVDGKIRDAGRGQRRPRTQDLRGAQAISEAPSAAFPGVFDQRIDDTLVRARGRYPSHPDSRPERRAASGRALSERGGDGGT